MLTDECPTLGESLHAAFDDELRVGQVATSARAIGRQGGDPTFDIDSIVAPVGARIDCQAAEFLLVFTKVGRKRTQLVGAFMERELAQSGTANVTRVFGHTRKVQSGAR